MRAEWRDIVWECLYGEARLVGRTAPSSSLVERVGLVASVAPATPERSLFNCGVTRDRGALPRHYDELATP
jgi:hypothetical protein